MKKPRTKWIHADEMAFLKQYLKRNRYSSSVSIHSNDNNNSIHHLTDKDILSATDAAFLMTLTTMKSNDDHDLSNSNQSGVSHVDYYDNNGGQNSSPTHSIMNLSMATKRTRSGSLSSFERTTTVQHRKSNGTSSYGKAKISEPNLVDVETCDDNDHEDDEQQDDDYDEMDEVQHCSKKFKAVNKQELDDDRDHHENNGCFDLNNVKKAITVSSTSNGGEKMKRITLEAPESMLICFDVHHHNHNRHHHNNLSKWTPTTADDLTGSEMDIFADYVAMKLKSFSVTNRLEIMTKIWHLLTEVTMRQYSTSPPSLASLIPIITPHCPPGSTNLAPQDLR